MVAILAYEGRGVDRTVELPVLPAPANELLHGRHSALVLAHPPAESLDDVGPLIEQALSAAAEAGVTGQEVTPFVLARLHELSGGRTLEANRKLVADNAGLAAEVAVAYAGIAA